MVRLVFVVFFDFVEMKMCIMGLDYGSKTVGVAISDKLGITAQPKETITRKSENKLRKTYARIEELIKEYDIKLIVLGRPINMNGSIGERVKKCDIFKEGLQRRTGLEIVYVDERLTTIEANEILAMSSIKKEDRKKFIDSVAASIILKEYMDSKGI